jgi:hypothetical protein
VFLGLFLDRYQYAARRPPTAIVARVEASSHFTGRVYLWEDTLDLLTVGLGVTAGVVSGVLLYAVLAGWRRG